MRDELVCKGKGYFLICKKSWKKIIGRNHIFVWRNKSYTYICNLCLGVFVVAGEVRLSEVVQPSDARVAVVDAFLRDEVLAGVYGEKYLPVDLGTPVLRYLLWYDGIHVFTVLMV